MAGADLSRIVGIRGITHLPAVIAAPAPQGSAGHRARMLEATGHLAGRKRQAARPRAAAPTRRRARSAGGTAGPARTLGPPRLADHSVPTPDAASPTAAG